MIYSQVIQIYQAFMSNLQEIERHRLKLYGDMLRNDLTERRKVEKMQKEEKLRYDAEQLNRHIENTRKMDAARKMETKELNNSILMDNMGLSMLKKNESPPRTYAQQGSSFIADIHQMDSFRLDRLKNDLKKQTAENTYHSDYKRYIDNKIKQIEKLEAERHNNRMKQMQMESIKNYEEIKRKHQQDMQLFAQHKQLMEQNDEYRSKIEGFTNVQKGIFDRYNRNQYIERRASLLENQDQIKKQIDELDRKKNQETINFKMNKVDLDNSMLASVFNRAPRFEPRAYSKQLKNQMIEDSQKKNEEKTQLKEKIEMNNIYGGVHGKDREKMIRIIDRRLGLDQFQSRQNSSKLSTQNGNKGEESLNQTISQDSQSNYAQSQRYMTPRSSSRGHSVNKSEEKKEKSLPPIPTLSPPQNQNINQSNRDSSLSQYDPSSSQATSSPKKLFRSFDLIALKNRYYGVD